VYTAHHDEHILAHAGGGNMIGWIGTGIMGASMARNLMNRGHELCIYTRTREKARPLLEAGAHWGASPAEVAQKSTIVFSMVGYPRDVAEVALGEHGVMTGFARAAGDQQSDTPPVYVDMSTSEPTLAQRIAAKAAGHGVATLDAPVSGGDIGAREGKLAIMVGGEAEIFTAVLPYFNIMGTTIQHMGPAGAGQHTKMVNQILVASGMVATVEALLYAVSAGLDMDGTIDVVGSGAAASWAVNNLGRRIARGDMEPGFMIRHFMKDMGIALNEAERMQLSLPGLALARQFYTAAVAEGLEDRGTQALYAVYQRLNGRDDNSR